MFLHYASALVIGFFNLLSSGDRSRLFRSTCRNYGWVAICVLGPFAGFSRADEPPVHPRNETWNSYTKPGQYHPGWGNYQAVCESCQMPAARPLLPGWRGQPYTDQTLGCRCRLTESVPMVKSPHWPRPFSGFWDQQFPGSCDCHSAHRSGMGSRLSCGNPLDLLNPLADVKLVANARHDSGYYGPECDPYGKLGYSQQPSAIATATRAVPPANRPAFPNPVPGSPVPNLKEQAPGPLPNSFGQRPNPTAGGSRTAQMPTRYPLPVR